MVLWRSEVCTSTRAQSIPLFGETVTCQQCLKWTFNWSSTSFLWSVSFPTGKKNKLRVYYLSWLRNRILHNDPEVEKKQGWITVGELEGCVHYKVGMKTHFLWFVGTETRPPTYNMGTSICLDRLQLKQMFVECEFVASYLTPFFAALLFSCSEIRED